MYILLYTVSLQYNNFRRYLFFSSIIFLFIIIIIRKAIICSWFFWKYHKKHFDENVFHHLKAWFHSADAGYDELREMVQLAKVTIIRRYCYCYQHYTCAVYHGRERFRAVRTVHHICKKESCIIGDHVTRVVLGCTWCGVQVERVDHADLTGWGEENRRLLRIRRGYNLQRQSLSTSLPLNGRPPFAPEAGSGIIACDDRSGAPRGL